MKEAQSGGYMTMDTETGDWVAAAIPAARWRVVWGFGAWKNFESLEEAGKLFDELDAKKQLPYLIDQAPAVGERRSG